VTNINIGSNINIRWSAFHQSQGAVSYSLRCVLAACVLFGFLYVDNNNGTSEATYGSYTAVVTSIHCFCLKSSYV
jgi:hypothetical protein